MVDFEKEVFLRKYKLVNVYREEKIAWNVITEIVEDYREREKRYLRRFVLKYENISKDNYYKIISDFGGIRVLLLTKEDWEAVHSKIEKIVADVNNHLHLEESKAYIRYGDRDVF